MAYDNEAGNDNFAKKCMFKQRIESLQNKKVMNQRCKLVSHVFRIIDLTTTLSKNFFKLKNTNLKLILYPLKFITTAVRLQKQFESKISK